jgi:hypothetical protein
MPTPRRARDILNNLIQDCQDMDSHIETVNLSVDLALKELAGWVRSKKEVCVLHFGKYNTECSECRIRFYENSKLEDIAKEIEKVTE